MKAFGIAMFAMGIALFLAAIFWPDRAHPVVQRQQHLVPAAATIEKHEPRPAQAKEDVWGTPPQPAKPAPPAKPKMQSAETSAANVNATSRQRLANVLTDLQLS